MNPIGHKIRKLGLAIPSELDENICPTGQPVTEQQIQSLSLKRDRVHGAWKYTLLPRKDAYDVYNCVRNVPEGPNALAKACRHLLEFGEGVAGFTSIDAKFRFVDSFGLTSVRQFVEETRILQNRSPDQWQQVAFGQVDAWSHALGLRE